MPLWRCPHCGTPQAETSRCWVCRRSTTSCATCRHFRRGVANGLGVCGLDPRHTALRGTEIRACWTAATVTGAGETPSDQSRGPAAGPPGGLVPDASRRPPRTFVPVDELVAIAERAAVAVTAPAPVGPPTVTATPAPDVAAGTPSTAGWSLWGELEG